MDNELIDQRRELEIESVLNQSGSEKQLGNQPIVKQELRGLVFNMPDGIRQQFGCVHCEWKGVKDLCMLVIRDEKVKRDDHVPIWICPRRAAYLASFVKESYPNNSAMHTNTTMWRKAILTTTMHQQQMTDMFKYQQLQNQIEQSEDDLLGLRLKYSNPYETEIVEKEKEIDKLQKKSETARANWMQTTNGLLFYNAKDMDREQPKKIDISHTTNIQDMGTFLNNSAKELQKYKVIDGEIVHEDNK